MSLTHQPGARFVDPVVLARIGNLELIAKTVVDGLINGTHRSPFFGASVDFAEHRGYVAGDDIRRVDWRVYARTDKYYIKEFEADSNANFSVLLDVSKSMGFGAKISKLDYAKTLAACLAYLANAQRDRVGLITFDEAVVDHVPPSAKHLDVVLHTLDQAKATRPGHLVGAAAQARRALRPPRHRRRDLGFLRRAGRDLPRRRADLHRGNDVVLFHVLDPQEIDFSFAEPSSFEDMESGDQMPIVPTKLAADYRALVQAHIETLTKKAAQQPVDYMLLNTTMPLDFALFRFLSMRQRLARTR